MTSNEKTEETKIVLDTVDDQEQKSNEYKKDGQEGSKNESVGEESGVAPVAEEPTAEKETKEDSSIKTAEQTNKSSTEAPSLKSNKKNKKTLNPKDLIKTPNKHDVLLGRGKPVSPHFRYEYLQVL